MPRYTTPIVFQIDIATDADCASDAANEALEQATAWLREIKEQEEENAFVNKKPIKHKFHNPTVKESSFLTRDYK